MCVNMCKASYDIEIGQKKPNVTGGTNKTNSTDITNTTQPVNPTPTPNATDNTTQNSTTAVNDTPVTPTPSPVVDPVVVKNESDSTSVAPEPILLTTLNPPPPIQLALFTQSQCDPICIAHCGELTLSTDTTP